MSDPVPTPSPPSTRRLIGFGLLTRLVVDTMVQLFFPFAPIMARGLGIDEVTLLRLVSLRSSTGLASPYFGVLADRYGYQPVLRLGLIGGGVGALIIAFSQGVWLTAVGMLLNGLGLLAFVPTFQAYVSARLPFHQRARGLGILEYGWALAGIVGLPLVGFLIDGTSWRIPLLLLAGLLFVSGLGFGRLVAPLPREERPPATRFELAQLRRYFQFGSNGRSTITVLITGGLVMFGGLLLFTSYGIWLESEYGLDAVQLGQIAFLLGVADICGSGLISLIGDRFGKRRSVIGSTFLATIGFGLLPLLNTSLPLALVGLSLVRFSFEFSIVGNMILLSEQAPEQRGKVMTLGSTMALLGSTVAGLIGPQIYISYGLERLALASLGVMALTCGLYIFLARERAV